MPFLHFHESSKVFKIIQVKRFKIVQKTCTHDVQCTCKQLLFFPFSSSVFLKRSIFRKDNDSTTTASIPFVLSVIRKKLRKMRHGSCPQAQTDHAHTSDRTCGTRPYGNWGTTGRCAYRGDGEVFELSGIGSGFQSSETTSTPKGRVFFLKMEHVVVVFGYEIREIRVFETREVFSSFFFFHIWV